MPHAQPPFGNRPYPPRGFCTRPRDEPLTDLPQTPLAELSVCDAYGQHRPTEGASPIDVADMTNEGFNHLHQGLTLDPFATAFFDCRARAFSPILAPWAQTEPLAHVECPTPHPAMPDNPIHAPSPLADAA